MMHEKGFRHFTVSYFFVNDLATCFYGVIVLYQKSLKENRKISNLFRPGRNDTEIRGCVDNSGR